VCLKCVQLLQLAIQMYLKNENVPSQTSKTSYLISSGNTNTQKKNHNLGQINVSKIYSPIQKSAPENICTSCLPK